MRRSAQLLRICGFFGLTLLAATSLKAQSQSTPAPVPAQLLSAKKVFISNAGADAPSIETLQDMGDSQLPYNSFYAAMKAWGKYELVSSPSDADLVFQVYLSKVLAKSGNVSYSVSELRLRILDSKTHFILWTIGKPVEGAIRMATRQKNFEHSVAAILEDLKIVVGQPAGAPGNLQ